MTMNRRYLGDAVYVDLDDFGDLILTAENGLRVTNTIVLEYDVWLSLKAYVEKHESNK